MRISSSTKPEQSRLHNKINKIPIQAKLGISAFTSVIVAFIVSFEITNILGTRKLKYITMTVGK